MRFVGYLFYLLILCLSSRLYSQALSVEGVVVDGITLEPLVAATIQYRDGGTYSDLAGRFSFDPEDVSYFVISYIGYKNDTIHRGESWPDSMLKIQLIPTGSLLDLVTVTTGKFEQALGKTTASIEILQPQLLEQTNTTSIDEVLNKVAGVAIIDGQANIRGGSGYSYGAGSRVLVLVDDIPAYQADAGFPNWDDFPVEGMAQMEVVKGAASALYGSSALNGIINLRTSYATEEPKTKASLFYNTLDAPRLKSRKWWSSPRNGVGGSLSDARRMGKVDLVHSIYMIDRDNVGKDSYNRYVRLSSKVRYKVNDALELGLRGLLNDGQNQGFFYWKDAEDLIYSGDSSTYNTGNYLRYSIDPYLKYVTPRGDRHEIKSRFFNVKNQNNAQRSNESKLYYSEYQYLHRIPRIKAVLTTGIVSLHTRVRAELYGENRLSSDNVALFAQWDHDIIDRWKAVIGARWENNTVKGPVVSESDTIFDSKVSEAKPVIRLASNYQMAKNTFLRASWGQGYRYPTIAEKYIRTSFGATMVSPNLQLQSETGWSGEIGIKQGWRVSSFEGIFDLAAYWSEYFDMMEFIFTGLATGFQSQNIGDTRIRGIDISVSGRGSFRGVPMILLAGYTYVDPRFQNFTEMDSIFSTAGYNILKYRSKHLAKFDLQTEFNRFSCGLSIQYTSNVESIDRIFFLFIPGLEQFRDTHRDYALTDLRVHYQVNDHLRLGCIANNLFNVEYSVRPGLLAAPRSFNFRLDYEF